MDSLRAGCSPAPAEGGLPSRRGMPSRPPNESGFALLVVFLMAAIAAITLYMEVPRLVFQSQRQK